MAHKDVLAAVARATAIGRRPEPPPAPAKPEPPPAPVQFVKHAGAWHILVVATMRTGCCDKRIAEIREVASEIPADGKRCKMLGGKA